MTHSNQKEAIQSALDQEVLDIRSFSQGNNAILYLIDTNQNERYVAKVSNSDESKLDIEGWMLNYLNLNSSLPVPQVVYSSPNMLIMSYIPSGGKLDSMAQEHAAELIASLHTIKSDTYGLEKDTLIGPLDQPNDKNDNWIDFFISKRLLYMAKKGAEEGVIEKNLLKKIETLSSRLHSLIGVPAEPSLIHGDLWGGNILTRGGKITAFIDPAIYYADPEIELAFTTLFGTFDERFFKRYNELSSIRDGFFEVRKDIYNIYPLLVHARLFGRSYAAQAEIIINKFI